MDDEEFSAPAQAAGRRDGTGDDVALSRGRVEASGDQAEVMDGARGAVLCGEQVGLVAG